MSLLTVTNLSVGFQFEDKKIQAVSDISFTLDKGETLGIVGESGSGQSVTALSILGLLPYPKAFHSSKSSIKFDNKELLNSPDINNIRGKRISFIFQEPLSSLNPLHKIGHQITEAIILHQNISKKDAQREALRLLNVTGISNAKDKFNAYPHELSGGQRQRVMIAMAIANKPDILIADEPTTALDVTIQAQIIELLQELQKKMGMSIIFISHDLNLVKNISDKIAVMKNGKIVDYGSTENVFNHPQSSYTKKLISSFTPLKTNNKKNNCKILEVDSLVVKFPIKYSFWGKVKEYFTAVNSVSFSLNKGETLGIVGESGSGKSTLALAICKLIKHSGNVLFNGNALNKEDKKIRQKIQIVFQDPFNSLNPRMNVSEIIGEGLLVHFPNIDKKNTEQKIISVLKEVGLSEEDMYKYPHEFSGGQRQRIAIARAIILEPELLILDEPTSALDVTIQMQILKLLQKIQANRCISYIFISHNMQAIQSLSDNIAVMKDGKFVEIDNAESIFKYPKHKYTKQLIKAST